MPVLIVSLLMLVVSAFAALVSDALTSANNSRLESRQLAQAVVAQEVDRYFRDTGTYPTSLANLIAAPGYSHLKTFAAKPNGGYVPSTRDMVEIAQSNALVDSYWTSRRAVVFSLKNATESSASYLGSARNSCPPASGASDFANSLSWCAPKDNGFYKRFEQRDAISSLIIRARIGQNFTLEKFVARYNGTSDFPAGATATPLTSLVTAAASGSTVGTSAATCNGTFVWQTIPFDCSDLYNRFGQPVSYQLLAPKRMVLLSNTTLTDNSGATVSLATEVNLP